jgi:hypothetical protein
MAGTCVIADGKFQPSGISGKVEPHDFPRDARRLLLIVRKKKKTWGTIRLCTLTSYVLSRACCARVGESVGTFKLDSESEVNLTHRESTII